MNKHRKNKSNPLKAVIAMALCTSVITHAKPQLFEWNEGTCSARATFDDKKVSLHQLRSTLALLEDRLTYSYPIGEIEENRIKNMHGQDFLGDITNFINHPAIEVVRKRMIERDNFFYEYQMLEDEVKRSKDYYLLDDFKPAQIPECQEIAQVIQSPPSEKKNSAARLILGNASQGSSDPNAYFASTWARWSQSDDQMNTELLGQYWHNCVNQQQPDITSEEQIAARLVFEKHMSKIQIFDCGSHKKPEEYSP
jgi:hypothetical protein